MFHLLAYSGSLGAAAANVDVPAVADQEVTTRNNHFILTDKWKLLLGTSRAATLTDSRLNVPSINAYARHHIFPVLQAATNPDDERLADYRDLPFDLPENEEIGVENSNAAAGAEQSRTFLWIAPPTWSRNIPAGIRRLTARATYSITSVAETWSPLGALTFTENLRGGTYAIVGANAFDANTLAVRFVFPRGNQYAGRRMRPGILSINALGNRPWWDFMGGMGLFGTFGSFEPPQVEIFSVNAAAHAGIMMVDLVYLGERY